MGRLQLVLVIWLYRGSCVEEVRGAAATLLRKWPGPSLGFVSKVSTLIRAISLPSNDHMW